MFNIVLLLKIVKKKKLLGKYETGEKIEIHIYNNKKQKRNETEKQLDQIVSESK